MHDKLDRGLMTLREAGELLCVCRQTLYRLFRRGKLKPVKIGTCTRVRRADVLRLIDGPFRGSNDKASE